MNTPAENTSWSTAVQRELDGLQRSVDSRFLDFSNRLDKSLTITEYNSDKRLVDLQLHTLEGKLDDNESDFEYLRTELRNLVAELRKELAAERARNEAALTKEIENRQEEHKTYVQQRQALFRWTVSMVMIPIVLTLVQLFLKK